jgi:hypothetical protein
MAEFPRRLPSSGVVLLKVLVMLSNCQFEIHSPNQQFDTPTEDDLIAQIVVAFPGIDARKGEQFMDGDHLYDYRGHARICGEATLNGYPLFDLSGLYQDSGYYDGRVHLWLTGWLKARGIYLEQHYCGEYYAFTIESALRMDE